MDDLPVKRLGTARYGTVLNQYLRLLLVCRAFYALITQYVLVDGNPIRTELLEMQMSRFCRFLSTLRYFHDPNSTTSVCDLGWYGQSIACNMYSACGHFWKSPLFFHFYSEIFTVPRTIIGTETLTWFRFLGPRLFKDRLVQTKRVENPPQLEVLKGIKDIDWFIYLGRYRWIHWADSFEFQVGEDIFPEMISRNSVRTIHNWIGLSILEFRHRKLNLQSMEGRYWLWFENSDDHPFWAWRFQIVDYADAKVTDFYQSRIVTKDMKTGWPCYVH